MDTCADELWARDAEERKKQEEKPRIETFVPHFFSSSDDNELCRRGCGMRQWTAKRQGTSCTQTT